ncbi:hypothetical protein NIIDMKKI_47120 [Mycobacterium kansasii]|uniref:Uncharacterized protein n=1 Tax=Mycobacterium kansasii TaxID=1768 RepID=A0A7G1IEI7_MYCKA|nr:hypothetical protein NIIDMKKI_47120 [Mycobacterium kansasii]
MPGKWQRRTLDPPSQQPVAEIALKTPQTIQVYLALVNPHPLSHRCQTGRAQCEKPRLIIERESIV